MKKEAITFILGILAIILANVSPIYAQDQTSTIESIKSSLFREAHQAYKEAKLLEADILAPKKFKQGVEAYNKASNDLKSQKSLEVIQKNLKISSESFNAATKSSQVAIVAFGSTIQARNDAKSSEAHLYANNNWLKAEEKFIEATRTAEDGGMKDAKKKADESEKLFRSAELEAIKINYINEAYSLLDEAEKLKVKDYAPKTLENAKYLVNAAEDELEHNRYDTDYARIYARMAKREAKHAIHLTKLFTELKSKKQTMEDLRLWDESFFVTIGTSLDFVTSFENGMDAPTLQMVDKISKLKQDLKKYSADLFDAEQENALLKYRVNELELNSDNLRKRLGDVESEKTLLAKRLDAQARLRKIYDEVENLFLPGEAVLVRSGNDIIIRLTGLSFAVGKVSIDSQYNGFLGKIVKAIDMFPQSAVTIEGHTDSYGSDQSNLQLSLDRAQAVRRYIVSNSSISENRMVTMGHGESRPIATNETDQGRAKNRRIELTIHPNLPAIN